MSSTQLSAGQFGLFTYEVIDGTVEITDYPQDAVGEVKIPGRIDAEGQQTATVRIGGAQRFMRLVVAGQ